MFKPTKKKSIKATEKADFKLEFHATRVPQRGWDKLLVSLVSLETNKVTAKTGKAQVKNGTCQWLEPIVESAFLVQDSGGKDAYKAPYKLMVSMGLSRFGILGEATINLADYMQAVVPVSLPLQLQNCSSGSILHVKIQRIGSKTATRELEDQREAFMEGDHRTAFLDASQQGYDPRGADSHVTADKDDSASTSRHSSDSVEVPRTPELSESRVFSREGRGEELASPSSSIGSCSGRQELGNIFHDYARFSRTDIANQQLANEYTSLAENANLFFSPRQSSKSSEDNNKADSQFVCDVLPSWDNGKSKELEVAETTIKELRLEAASWEKRVKQMEGQMEALNKQLAEETTRNADLQRALASLGEEHDNAKLEMDNLRFTGKPHKKAGDGFKWQELQEELEYEKSLNSNLSLQLEKTQESNTELLLEIQELERMLQEKEELGKQSDEVLRRENAEKDLKKIVDSLKKELEELERDSKELTEENMDLILQLKQANDKLKINETTITQLEAKVKSELYEIETEELKNELDEMRVKLRDCEESYESKLATSRTLIDDLNSSVMMVRTKNARLESELQTSQERVSELLKEMESLKSEIDGHEREKSLFSSQKAQLKGLRDKASKAEQEHLSALKRVEELEAVNRELKGEKSRDLTAIKKQLEGFQEHALATDSKYRDALKEVSRLREERVNLDKELATLLQTKDAAEATTVQLQSFNMVLQENLHSEQLKNSELVQQCEEKESKSLQLCEEWKVNETQLKVLEQTVKELKAQGKEMENKAGSLREENMLCRSHVKELELQVASLEKETLALQTSRSACEAELQSLQVLNGELSEKLKNAQEDIDWARENTNTLVNEIRELEGEIKSDMEVQKHLKQSVSALEHQKQGLQCQLEELSNKNSQLEKDVLSLEERCKDALNEKDALLVSIQEQKSAQDVLEASFQTLIKQQEDKIKQLIVSSDENRLQQVLLDVANLREEKAVLEEKLKNLQDMLNQAKKDESDDDNKVKQALLEASILADEKAKLEENVLNLEEMLKQVEKYASSLKQNLDFQFQEATVKEQDMVKKLDKATAEAQLLQNEKLDYLQKIMALEAQCAAGELEKKKVSSAMSKRESELEVLLKEKEDKQRVFSGLKEEKENLKVSLGFAEQEAATLREKVKSYDEASSLWEQSKASMEEKILLLQDAVAKENNIELCNLKKENNELRLKLSEQEGDMQELKKKVISLEEELQHKATTLLLLEKELEDKKSLSSNSGSLASLLAREAKDSVDWHEKVVVLEGQLESKVAELELSKQQIKEQQVQLSLKIKQLDLANNQLVKEQANTNMLTSLQNQNTALCQREKELLSKVCSQEGMQIEIESLKEEKRVLELALSNFNASVNSESLSIRIAALEMELAEVTEANLMYKKELQSAFAKQHNVHVAALENLGSVEKVIQDLADLKRRNMMLEDELKDMRERYFNMSLQFAEVEAEREELVMTIRTLRGAKKFMPYRSANF